MSDGQTEEQRTEGLRTKGQDGQKTGQIERDQGLDELSEGSTRSATNSATRTVATLKASQELHAGERVEVAITIFRPADVVYSFWRDFSNIPKFMKHVSKLDVVDVERKNRIRWHWETFAGFEMKWEAEIIDDVVDKLISWRTLPGSSVQNAGSVWFRPILEGQATEVVLRVMYTLPGGKMTAALAEFFGESPQEILKADLKRLRCLLESGQAPEESIFDVVGLGLSDANVELVVPPIH